MEQKKPVLILDFKRTWRDLAAASDQEIAVYTVGRRVCPFNFNPLIPPKAVDPKVWMLKIIDLMGTAYYLGDGVISLLRSAFDATYREQGVYDGAVERWPTMREVFGRLKERDTMGREAGWMSSAKRAMESLCFGNMDVLINDQGNNDHIESLLTQNVILELDGLSQADKTFFASALLLYIFYTRMAEPTRGVFKNAIVLEEAHNLLSGLRKGPQGGVQILEQVFMEIREFGVALILIDQSAVAISPSALGNLFYLISFNLRHAADQRALVNAMDLRDDRGILANLKVGQAVVSLAGRGVGNFMIEIPEFTAIGSGMTDEDVIRHMTKLGLYSVRKHPVREPAKNGQSDRESGGTLEEFERAFLNDILQYPESGVVERYKRLGLSSRLGDKFKNHLRQKELIEVHTKITNSGAHESPCFDPARKVHLV